MKTFKKGAATILSFTISLALMLTIFIYCLSIVVQNIGRNQLEFTAEAIARELVVCSSLSEAQELAEKEASAQLDGRSYISNVSAVVGLAGSEGSSSPNEWERGEYIYLFLSADIDRLAFRPARQDSVVYMMIEHSG